jgi:hypothetical protein
LPALNIILDLIYKGKADFVDATVLPDIFVVARDLKLNLPIVPERIEVSVVELER